MVKARLRNSLQQQVLWQKKEKRKIPLWFWKNGAGPVQELRKLGPQPHIYTVLTTGRDKIRLSFCVSVFIIF